MEIVKGKLMYASVHKPNTKFDADGVYQVDVVMSEQEALPLAEKLEGLIQERIKEEVKGKPALKKVLSSRPIYTPMYDEAGDETGEVKVKFKTKAVIRTKEGKVYNNKVSVVDSKRTPISPDTLIGNGSVGKVAFEPFAYYNASAKEVGLSLRLKALQVIDLVTYGTDPFEDEDGFTIEETAPDNVIPFDAKEEEVTESVESNDDF